MKIVSVLKISRKAILASIVTCGAIAVLAGLWALHVNISDNIHTVHAGTLYRSAQLSPESLENTIRTHGIETVINLRGAHANDKWYQDEISVAQKLNIQHIDFKLSASRVPNMKTLAQLQIILRNAPKPILIHCQGGADRSGLVSAMYEHSILGKPAEEAEDQLSFYYGHFPWLWSRSGAMDIAFENYVEKPHEFMIGNR